MPAAVYAIGDVHGCLTELRQLEDMIVADAAGLNGEAWMVLLGDLVDRGPASAQVLDHLCARPPGGLHRICLRGNHEAMFLEAIDSPRTMANFVQVGGAATLMSYGLSERQVSEMLRSKRQAEQALQAYVPEDHVEFLRALPVALSLPGYILVHAGLMPGKPLEQQSSDDLLWIREAFTASDFDFGATIVHGHTPVDVPEVSARRINVDSGCYVTGRLTTVRLSSNETPRLLQTAGPVQPCPIKRS